MENERKYSRRPCSNYVCRGCQQPYNDFEGFLFSSPINNTKSSYTQQKDEPKIMKMTSEYGAPNLSNNLKEATKLSESQVVHGRLLKIPRVSNSTSICSSNSNSQSKKNEKKGKKKNQYPTPNPPKRSLLESKSNDDEDYEYLAVIQVPNKDKKYGEKGSKEFVVHPNHLVAKMRSKGNIRGSSNQFSATLWVQEKGSRNKRKFLSDPPLGEPHKFQSCSQNEHPSYEFSAEGSEGTLNPGQFCLCQMCRLHPDVPDTFQVEVKVSGSGKSPEVEPAQLKGVLEAQLKGGLETVDFHDADWSDLSENQLEELCLANLDMIFKSAIKQIAAHGYDEDVVTKNVLRADLCYGCKDTVSNIVENTLTFLQSGQESDAGKDHFFENLEQLEKYILAEMVCVLREVRPFFSTGDAMWCLLICDMNVSHACAVEGDTLNGLGSGEVSESSSSVSALPQMKLRVDGSEDNVPNVSKLNPFPGAGNSQTETTSAMGIRLANPNPCNTAVSAMGIRLTNLNSSNPAVSSMGIHLTNPNPSNPAVPAMGIHLTNPNPSNPTVSATGIHLTNPNPSNPAVSAMGIHLTNPDPSNPAVSAMGVPNLTFPNPSNPAVHEELPPEKENPLSTCCNMEKSLGAIQEFIQANTQPSSSAEKSVGGKKGHAGKRESVLKQKSFHFEKNCRGAMRSGKLSSFGGLILDKKPKAGTGSPAVNPKNPSSKVKKAVVVSASQADGNQKLAVNAGLSSTSTSNPKTVNTPSAVPTTNTGPSLSVQPKSSSSSDRLSPSCYGIPFDEATGRWAPKDEKDEMIMKLIPRVEDLQNQLQGWTEWANHKVMQAARRLGKDKVELKTLRQEKEEAERFQKERQALEDNTVKKLTEMEHALFKATTQVALAHGRMARLEAENADDRREMEEAKAKAAESAASYKEVSKREKKMLKKFELWEKQKASLQEELTQLRRHRAQLELQVKQAQAYRNQLEALRKQEQKAKEEYLGQAESVRKERQQFEATANGEEAAIKIKVENDVKLYKVDIRKLENKIGKLKMKNDPSKASQLQWGAPDDMGNKGVKRERECVMCLAEERSVVFLPCAHQVVCPKCNDIHEKHGMKECPSCRTPIQARICARFARP